MNFKNLLQLSSVSILCLFLISHKAEKTASRDMMTFNYDQNVNPWEQPNPIFRWPLPQVEGEAVINIQFVNLITEGSESNSNLNYSIIKSYLEDVFNPHNIGFNFRTETNYGISSEMDLLDSWKTKLPTDNSQITVYVINDTLDADIRSYHNTTELVSNKIVLPFSELNELKVYTAKSLGHMLGLLPTYFENGSLGVPAEDANNCGHAGDFVCDTPFDYLGLKNDVKKRNCKYKGDMGRPDTKNIMSNSWTECMDQITSGQANKIRYNLSEIPVLQAVLNKASSIALNVGIANQPTINQFAVK